MFKKIKSLLIAGLLVLGTGFATVDSYAAETKSAHLQVKTIDNNNAEYNQDGIVIDIVNITGNAIPEATQNPANYDENEQYIGPVYDETTYHFSITWDPSKIKAVGSEIGYLDASTAKDKYLELSIDNKNGKAVLTRTFVPGSVINFVDLGYELVNNEEEQNPVVSFNDAEQKVINKYRESMAAVGVLNNGERQIDTSFMIEKQAWEDFIADVNAADNYVTIEAGNEKGEYHVYTNVSGEKKLIEVIFIDFFESGSKGWVPGITPGTGQSLAIGGIVIGTVAVIGLLVNNKRKKIKNN